MCGNFLDFECAPGAASLFVDVCFCSASIRGVSWWFWQENPTMKEPRYCPFPPSPFASSQWRYENIVYALSICRSSICHRKCSPSKKLCVDVIVFFMASDFKHELGIVYEDSPTFVCCSATFVRKNLPFVCSNNLIRFSKRRFSPRSTHRRRSSTSTSF